MSCFAVFPISRTLASVSVIATMLLAGCGPSPEQVAREAAMKKLEQAGKEVQVAKAIKCEFVP